MEVVEFKSLIEREVDRLFNEHPPVDPSYWVNPVTRTSHVPELEPIEPLREEACRALLAREWFRFHAPPDAQPLPISSHDLDAANFSGIPLRYMVFLFARSLAGRRHDFTEHPSFADFVSGVLWDAGCTDGEPHRCSYFDDDQLKKRFPPRRLEGLLPSFIWLPPKRYAEVMEEYRKQKSKAGFPMKARRKQRGHLVKSAQGGLSDGVAG